MNTKAPSLPTIGAIASRLGESVHRVAYVIRSRGITPAGIAGNSRVFTEADVNRIASELRRIDEEREGVTL